MEFFHLSKEKNYDQEEAYRSSSCFFSHFSSHSSIFNSTNRLSEYEALHKRCGPHTEAYKRKVRKLESGHFTDDHFSDCKYLVRIPLDGLGNRMLSLVSTFLYALLTNRVLLVHDKRIRMSDLFCEPFPETTWLLPRKFPIWKRLDTLNQNSPESYGNLLDFSGKFSSLAFLYLHIAGGYNDNDQRFFCDHDQNAFQNVSSLIMKSNFYFIPSLFLIPSKELLIQAQTQLLKIRPFCT
uniref:galactoside 2-alpha-L-fucosyltransferase-like n=1 Tax=Erigeron canadensis TaxID=72917 RepID=UPI001CB8A3A2|nr:galactoside 2-alpha-L-fucosyltransferase-like [Erigeron canadensis]